MNTLNRIGGIRDWVPWVMGITIALMLLSVGKLAVKRYSIQREIEAGQSEISRANAKRDELLTLLQYVESPTYAEEQARLKFGLAKPGEKLAVIPSPENENSQDISGADPNRLDESAGPKRLNYNKWWSYFFK